MNKYKTYDEASAAARSLGIRNHSDYILRYKEDPKLPREPGKSYKKEWRGLRAFLGTALYETFDEAVEATRRLGISSRAMYLSRYHEDPLLPSHLAAYYGCGWPEEFKRRYETLAEASSAAKKLGISSWKDYSRRYHEDPMLPGRPEVYYRKNWEGVASFLGASRHYLSLDEVTAAVARLGIATMAEYQTRYKEDALLPSDPRREYSDWVGYKKFFAAAISTLKGEAAKEYARKVRGGEYYETYEEASHAARSLGIRTYKDYKYRFREDSKLYHDPSKLYGGAWKGFPSFLGERYYESYDEAIVAVKFLRISSRKDYAARRKEDPRLPANLASHYGRDWPEEFDQKYKDITDASAAVRRLGILTARDYFKRYREDSMLPARPNLFYKGDWDGFESFIGAVKNKYPTLEQAAVAVARLLITRQKEYRVRYTEDPMLPRDIRREYKDFPGFKKFFAMAAESLQGEQAEEFNRKLSGCHVGGRKKAFYLTLAEAKVAVRKLGIKTQRQYRHSYKRDRLLPFCPEKLYSMEWKGFKDFLTGKDASFGSYQNIASSADAARRLGIRGAEDYYDHYELDIHLPADPIKEYEQEWGGWELFLGESYDVVRGRYFESLQAATSVVQKLGLVSRCAYLHMAAGDNRLPLSPEKYYAESWKGWRVFLGFKGFGNLYDSYFEAREVVHGFSFRSEAEYSERYRDLDARLPGDPGNYYFDDWKGWKDYLGVRKLYSFEEAIASVRKLGIRTEKDYRIRYHEDPCLSACPRVYYKDEWVSAYHFFGREKFEVYGSLAEAREAARKLGITTLADYKRFYKNDPKLPSDPWRIYREEWVNGNDFLSYAAFYTYSEAKAVMRLHGISSLEQYAELQKTDVRLPRWALNYYRSECNSFAEFLLPSRCESLEDVKYAVRVLNIKNSREYREVYKRYACLPANPDRVFGDWVDWYDLCDIPRPYSYEETRELVLDYGVGGISEYRKFCKDVSDPRVPRDPETVYKGQWENWYAFTGRPEPFQTKYIRAPYRAWAECIDEFVEVARGGETKEHNMCRFVRDHVQVYGLGLSPEVFLTSNKFDMALFEAFISESVGSGRLALAAVKEFCDFVIREKLTFEDEETGERVRVPGATNPFTGLVYEGVSPSRAGETNKPALAYQYINALRNWILPDSAQDFSDLAHLQRFDVDWVEVEPSVVDYSDPNCVVREDGGKTKIWFPGNWMLTFALASVPARGRQLAYNDSGEADVEVPKLIDGNIVWLLNDSPLAGMTDFQGFVKKYPNGIIGMNFTSNKTSVRGEGYDIPWIPEKLANWMIRLRDWQAKYNPIKRVMPWVECARTNLNKRQLLEKGGNCFLFRDFGEEEPANYSSRLKNRLAAAIYHSQPDGVVLAECKGNPASISMYDTPYTPHSMRVSLITAYVMEFGLPIEYVMKIAGHSNIVMSLYYVKVNSEGLRVKFSEGEKRALSNQLYATAHMLEQNRIDEIRSSLIQDNDGAIQRFSGASLPGSILFRDYGFCPFAGARCSDGGPLIGGSRVREPVVSGYLGMQNCVRCRHFVTGPVFIGGLLSLANEVSLQASIQFDKIEDLNKTLAELMREIDELDDTHQDAEAAGERFDVAERVGLEMRVRKLQSEVEAASKKADLYLCDLQAVTRLINQSQAVVNEQALKDDSGNAAQLIIQTGNELEVAFEDSSRFHLLSEVCENAEIYESASAEIALPMRSQMLDRMIGLNNMAPKMYVLDKKQQLVLGNQLTNFLLSRVKTWSKVDALIEGRLLLSDLAEHERIEPKDISSIIEGRQKKIGRERPRAIEGEIV
ncbi:gamma-mobile-trio integrase GmtZ [Pseudomonas nicosulfuronedens]